MKIKQGNDVRGLKYTTSKEGEQINFLEVDNLKVFAVNARHDYKRYEASEMDITSDELVIYFTAFPGPVGLYHLLVEFDIPDSVNEGGIRKIIRGWENAFQIVHFYEAEDTVGAEFVDEVTFGLDGKSYYTIWLKYHEGTEEEMIAWHRQPAVDAADELLSHPLYIGADHYVYAWDHTTQSYNKTEIYVKGDAFSIAKTYLSVAAMEADFEGTDTKPGDFVIIESGDVEDPDNSKLYVKGSTGWGYLTDLSGAIGFTGKTPQLSIGTVTTGAAGSSVAVTLSEDGVDASGNPKFKLNFAIPQGAKGDKGDTGKTAYELYLETTTDNPPKSESEYALYPITQGDYAKEIGDSYIVDIKAIQPAAAFLKRITADGGTCADKSLLAKFFTEKSKSLATMHCCYFPHLAMKTRTSGINQYCNKVYDFSLNNYDGVQATEAVQQFVGGYIAPGELRCLKYVERQSQTGLVAFQEKSYLSTDSWTLILALKPNRKGSTSLQLSNAVLAINSSNIVLYAGATTIQGTISPECGKILMIEIQYSNGAGLMKVNNIPLATTVVAGAIVFNRIAYMSATPFDGSLYYWELRNERISESESQANYNFLRSLIAEIEGIDIGNQHHATSNLEVTVVGNSEVIPEMQNSTTAENAELITDATARDFSSDSGWWTKSAGVTISGGVCNIKSTAGESQFIQRNVLLTVGRTYVISIEIKANRGGSLRLEGLGSDNYDIDSTVGVKTFTLIAVQSYLIIKRASICDIDIDNASLKLAGWADLLTPAWCYYNNDPANGAVCGKLYNWYAAELIAKHFQNWRVHFSADSTQLATYLGGTSVAGSKLKKEGLTYWTTPNTGATNESGLSVIGAGARIDTAGSFVEINQYGYSWCRAETSSINAGYIRLGRYNDVAVLIGSTSKKLGLSIRLMRNRPTGAQRKEITTGYVVTNFASGTANIDIPIPFGHRVTAIRILSETNIANFQAILLNSGKTALETLFSAQSVVANASKIYDANGTQTELLQDGFVRLNGTKTDTAARMIIFIHLEIIAQ